MGPISVRGSLPALVTPLTTQRDVDEVGVDVLVERALADGASGVLVAGSTGEGTLLSRDQRVQLTQRARAAVDRVGGDHPNGSSRWTAPVVAGASGPTVDDVDADVVALATAGADLVLVLAPSTYPLRSDDLVDFHIGVAERTEVATLIYHIPQLTGSSLTPDAVRALAGHPRIVGMKDSSPDAERRATFAAVARDVEGFDLVTGHAPTLRSALRAGVSGSITAIANIRQRQVVALHDAVSRGDDALAERMQQTLTATTDAMTDVGASVPAALKAVLQLDGVITDRWCRPPLGSVGPGRLDHVRTAMMR